VAAAGAACGAALLLGFWRGRPSRSADPGPAEVWVVDRGARRVVGLCRRLVPVTQLALESGELRGSGRRLAPAGPGAAWVATGTRVLQVGEDGIVRVDRPAPRVRDLAPQEDGGVVLLERDGTVRRVGADGQSRARVDVAGARRIAGRGTRLLVACVLPAPAGGPPVGWLALVDAGPRAAIVGLRRLAGLPLDLAPATGLGDGWWLLEGNGGRGDASRRLARLTPLGGEAWSRSVPRGAAWLAPGPDGVWLEDPERSGLLRIGPRARQRAWFEVAPALRRPRAATALGAGLLLATPGALVALAPDGRVVGSQGGFADLAGLALAPAVRPRS